MIDEREIERLVDGQVVDVHLITVTLLARCQEAHLGNAEPVDVLIVVQHPQRVLIDCQVKVGVRSIEKIL